LRGENVFAPQISTFRVRIFWDPAGRGLEFDSALIMSTVYNPPMHRYAVFTASCTFLLLIAGALVTSNDAGLSIPDWPLAYGSLTPPMVGGIRYEFTHRVIATCIGLLT